MGLSDADHHPRQSVQKQGEDDQKLGPTITIGLQKATSRQTLGNPLGALSGRRVWVVCEDRQMPPVRQGVMADAVSPRRRKGGQIGTPWTSLDSLTIREFQENDSSNFS